MKEIDYIKLVLFLIVSVCICFGVGFFNLDKRFLVIVIGGICDAIWFIECSYKIAKSNNEFED